jgi:hypothetical protein
VNRLPRSTSGCERAAEPERRTGDMDSSNL